MSAWRSAGRVRSGFAVLAGGRDGAGWRPASMMRVGREAGIGQRSAPAAATAGRRGGAPAAARRRAGGAPRGAATSADRAASTHRRSSAAGRRPRPDGTVASARDARSAATISVRPVRRSASTSRALGHHLAAGPGQRVDQRDPAELQHQRPEVAGIEQLDPDVRVELTQPAQLAVLLAHEALLERRQLEVQVEVGQVEVGREALDDRAVEVPQDRERVRLVLPADLVEVEDPRQLRLARVGERGRSGRRVGVSGPSSGAARRCRRALESDRRSPCVAPQERVHPPHVVLVDGGPRQPRLVAPRRTRRSARYRRRGARRPPASSSSTTRPSASLPHAAHRNWTKTRSSRSARTSIRSAGTPAPHAVHPTPASESRRWSRGSIGRPV